MPLRGHSRLSVRHRCFILFPFLAFLTWNLNVILTANAYAASSSLQFHDNDRGEILGKPAAPHAGGLYWFGSLSVICGAMSPSKGGRGLRPRFKALVLVLCVLAVVVPTTILNYRTISYFLRPIWDTPLPPFQVIPHFYAEDIPLSQLCKLHGWRIRETPRRVFDAVIFSNEVDILEIRMQELLPFVTKFVVLESNITFTGQPKPLYFKAHEDRFSFATDKIVHYFFPNRPDVSYGDPFINENAQRKAMDHALVLAGIEDGDLLITADSDEIPAAHTIRLLQNCDGFPSPMHFQLRNYIYSYEFFVDSNSWRSSVQVYDKKSSVYSHGRRSDSLLADAGWHCSFCFRYVSDFVFKMTAYSHADRVRHSSFLNYQRIQDHICKGLDLFDMLPEEFTFKELIGKMGQVPKSSSVVHLPTTLVTNPDSYKFLLPGGCLREPDPPPLPLGGGPA